MALAPPRHGNGLTEKAKRGSRIVRRSDLRPLPLLLALALLLPAALPVGAGLVDTVALVPFIVKEDRGPFGFVLSNGEVTGQHRPGVVSGRGTPDDPYVVEGTWSSVTVQGTTAHVVFRDVQVRDLLWYQAYPSLEPDCVLITAAANVTFEGGHLCDLGGVRVENSRDVRFAGAALDTDFSCRRSARVAVEDATRHEALSGYKGFAFDQCPDARVSGGTFSSTLLTVRASPGARVEDNAWANDSGIVLADSPAARLAGNAFAPETPSDYGHLWLDVVEIHDSPGAVLRGNALTGGLILRSRDVQGCLLDVDPSNLVLGKPVRLLTGAGAVAPEDAGQVILCGTEDAVVAGLAPLDVSERVTLLHARRATLRDLDLGSPNVGVHVEGSADVRVENVTWRHRGDVRSVAQPSGVVAARSEGVSVVASAFRSDWGSGARGVALDQTEGASVERSSFHTLFLGVTSTGSRDLRFSQLTAHDAMRAVAVEHGANATVDGLSAEACDGACVYAFNVTDLRVLHSRLAPGPHRAIDLQAVRGGIVERNTVTQARVGLSLWETTRVEVRLNDLDGGERGIEVESGTSSITIHHNDLHGHSRSGVFVHPWGTVVARDNWWGCAEGPGAPACDAVEGDVAYEPWLAEPAAGSGAP